MKVKVYIVVGTGIDLHHELCKELILSNSSVILSTGLGDIEKVRSVNSIVENLDDFFSRCNREADTLLMDKIEDLFELKPLEFIDPYREPIPCVAQFIIRSGRIRETWNYYYCHYTPWIPPVQPKPAVLHTNKFMRRFQGNNKGRHWNRRRLK